jgi:hypothetical protein
MRILRGSPHFLQENVAIKPWPHSIPTQADLRNVGSGSFPRILCSTVVDFEVDVRLKRLDSVAILISFWII